MFDLRFLKLAVWWAGGGVLLAIAKVVMTEGRTAAEFSLYEVVPFAVGLLVLILLHFFLKRPARDGCNESGELTEGMQFAVDREKLTQERAELERLRTEIKQQLDLRAEQLNSREVALTDRLVQFHEWDEYPKPENGASSGKSPAMLVAQDQRVIELLDCEAKVVYARLKEGYYNPSGKLDPILIRDQVVDLITRVARVYRPDAENPLMETSVDQMLRAGSRVCLHLLIVLDRLPLNLHEETLSTLHTYIRNAIKAWDAYSTAEPYLSHMGRALYVGRYLAGASPLTMGITWAISEIGKRGAAAYGKKFMDQQAVSLIGDVVRIVGFEVATVFSGDFRHRSSDWVYGSELTNLMSRFPVSRENLAHSLREVGRLSLRNEYDRIFLYRCLSAHRTAAPLVNAGELLSADDRQNIARQLEKFYRDFIHGRTRKRLDSWRDGVEERLGVPLEIDVPAKRDVERVADGTVTGNESRSALESLAGFLTSVKGRPVRELATLIPPLESAKLIDRDMVQSLYQQLEAESPQLFEPPDIDPDSAALKAYLDDLIRLCVEVAPYDLQPDDFVIETAAYFGADIKTVQKQLDQKYCDFITERVPKDAPSSKPSPIAARMLIGLLEDDESPHFVYGSVKVLSLSGISEGVLVATQKRLLLASVGESCWTATADLSGSMSFSAEKIDGMVIDDCRFIGQWRLSESLSENMSEEHDAQGSSLDTNRSGTRLELTIPGAVLTRFENWFRPLLQISRGEWSTPE
ncbi:MAG: hypothetical protein O3B13_20745 [Planctomycetota bacterium]|nr:hypothetical protein [Planctomycetota bacterium]